MKKSVSIFLSVLVIIAVCCCLRFFISVPSGSLWTGYTVLYVSKDFPETEVLTELEQAGIQHVITLSRQSVPVVSYMTPVQPDAFDPLSYVSRRSLYFFDKAVSFQLYYIPEQYKDAVVGVAASLLEDHPELRVGFDALSSYPLAIPVICFAVFLFFIVISRYKVYMVCSGLFSLLFSVCSPMYTSGAAVCLILYSFFLFQKLWNRKGCLKTALRNMYVFVPLLLAVAVVFSGSISQGFLFILSCVGSTAALYLLYIFQIYISCRRRFKPLPVRSARCIAFINRRSVLTVLIPAIASSVFFVLFVSLGYAPSGNAGNHVVLPAPVRNSGSRGFSVAEYEKNAGLIRTEADYLPGMTEYITWAWNTLTFPYRSLNLHTERLPVIAADETIMYPVYVRSEQGIISEQLMPVYVFNDAFISTVIDGVNAENAGVELLLKQQNGFKTIEYSGGGIQNSGKKTSAIPECILLVCCFVIPTVMVTMFFWRKQR